MDLVSNGLGDGFVLKGLFHGSDEAVVEVALVKVSFVALEEFIEHLLQDVVCFVVECILKGRRDVIIGNIYHGIGRPL